MSTVSTESRTQRLKQRVLDAPYHICIERARFWTESFRSTEGQHPSIRAARALEHTLRNMTIYILDEELVVGNRSSQILGTILPLERGEVNVALKWDLESVTRRAERPFQISPEDKRELAKNILPYWRGRTVRDERKRRWDNPAAHMTMNLGLTATRKRLRAFDVGDMARKWYPVLGPRPRYIKRGGEELLFNNPGLVTDVFDVQGHLAFGHKNVLRTGFKGIEDAAAKKLEAVRGNGGDAQAEGFLEAVLICCGAAREFAERFARLAEEKAEQATEPARAEELRQIAEHCRRVPCLPPRTFHEAVQALWLAQVVGLIAYGMGSYLSVGRVDQYLQPFYEEDIRQGRITRQAATELMEELLIKLSCNLLLLPPLAKATAGELGGDIQAITVGGVGRDGEDATNDVSYMLLDAAANLRCMSNSFSIRIGEKCPPEFLERAMEVVSVTSGPALYSDATVVPALVKSGYSLEDARDYVIIGCVEPTSDGNTFGCTSGNDISLTGALEMALTDGELRFMGRKMGPSTGDPRAFRTFEDVMEAFKRQVEFCVDTIAEGIAIKDEVYAGGFHCPYVSCTLDGCVENARDMTQGGAEYNFSAINAMGFGTTVDSLAAMKRFVFDEKAFGMEELLGMLDSNFKGHERERKLLAERGAKYGTDNDEADAIARRVLEIFCNAVSSHSIARGGHLQPGFFSYGMHVYQGAVLGATPNGRKAGEPLSNSLSPCNGVETGGLTAMLSSIGKLDSSLVPNGYSINAKLMPRMVSTPEGREKLAALLRAYFKMGGMHVQFNVVSSDTLRAAQREPDEYKDLVVRISGYSGYFVDQGKAVQDDIIARTQFDDR